METRVQPVEASVIYQNNEVRIFVVDDDPMYRKAIEHYLRKNSNYLVFSFKTGEECFKDIHSLEPNIIVLDYRLNDSNPEAMNGLEVLKELKKVCPKTTILMLSSQESFEVATNSFKFGAYGYIVKNESAFTRLQHLIIKILDNNKAQPKPKKNDNYYSDYTPL